jgi:hypothetical protein
MDQPTPSQRLTATFSDDGNTITGRWEIAEDGTNYTTAAATPRAVT